MAREMIREAQGASMLHRASADAVHVRGEGPEARELEIRLVPWGVEADTIDGRESFARGAFAGVDPRRVTIESGGHGGPLVGVGTHIEERDDAAYLRARIAGTPAGDELLTLAREGVLTEASVTFLPVRHRRRGRAVERQAVDLRRVAILERGAYPGAGVVAVREAPTPVPDPEPEPEPTPDPAPTARALEAMRSEIGALGRLVAGGRTAEDPWEALRAGAAACYRAALTDPALGQLMSRALVDEITTDNPGLVPPGWINVIRGIQAARRPAVSAFGGPAALPDTGMDFGWPTYTGDIKTLVQKQAAQKTAIHSEKISFGKGSTAIESYGFGHDVAYQLILRSSPAYLEAANRILLGAFAYYQDASFVAAILATPGLGTGTYDPTGDTTGAGLRAALFAASMDVEAATGAPASFGLAASDVFGALGGAPGLVPPAYSVQNVSGTAQASTLRVNVSGLEIYHDSFLPPGTFLVSNPDAASYHAQGPMFVTAEDVERLGRNEAIWGMGASAIYTPAGIVEISMPVLPFAASASKSRKD